MKNRIALLVLFIATCFSNCFIGPAKEKNMHVDSVAVAQQATPVEEFSDVEAEPPPGRKIDFELSGLLLSRMLKEIAFMRNFNDSSSVINVRVLDNETVNPIGNPKDFEAKFYKYQAGSYTEGFNGLKEAFVKSMYTGDILWRENTYNNTIHELSDLEFVSPTQDPQPFKYINPDVVKWAWNNFYRNPSASSVSDVSLSTLYDIVFKKFVRTLLITHQDLKEKDLVAETAWYMKSFVEEKKNAAVLLGERYSKPDKYSKDEVNEFYYPLAMGFWIRRNIDGSEAILWYYLRIMVMDYDYDWGCKNFKICDRG